MLIDPSYEVKADYTALPSLVRAVHARWNVGVIALWYPILTSAAHLPMIAALEAAGLPKTLRHEGALSARARRARHGRQRHVLRQRALRAGREAARLDRLFAAL